jgi:hypothetical protein
MNKGLRKDRIPSVFYIYILYLNYVLYYVYKEVYASED